MKKKVLQQRAMGLAFALLCVCVQAHGSAPAPPDERVPSVTVRATRDPVDKSYRKMIKGMERFEKDHALAPAASLRFRLLPRTKSVDMNGVALKIVGDTITLPVSMGPDNIFALPRNAQALREDADLIANRKTTSMTWRALVQTPGLPPGTRRLGDLRLECLVGMESGLISNDPAVFGWLANIFYDADKICSTPDGNYLFFTDRPVFNVTLHAGTRTDSLPFKLLYAGGEQTPASLAYCDCQVLLDRSYYAPLWDKSWPDDTLLQFEYMDDDPTADHGAAQARPQ